MKWELLADKKVRNTFATKVDSLFPDFPDFSENIEIKWDLFKSAVITSTAVSRGYKRMGGQR